MGFRSIEEAIQKLSGTYLKDIVAIVQCTVNSVDKDALTCDCTPLSDVTDIPGVQLSAEVSDGFVVFPAVGSTVYVALTTRNNAFLLIPSDLDSVEISIPNGTSPETWTTLTLSNSGIQMNDGSYGGLIEIANLVTKLNNLVLQLQTQLSLIATGIAGAGGSYTPGTLSTFNKTDFENTLITHGK